jgi:hemoglobin-like flavoprotein
VVSFADYGPQRRVRHTTFSGVQANTVPTKALWDGGPPSDTFWPVTPDKIHLLRKSFSRVEPKAQIAVLSFYRRLFELAPELRPLFRTGIEEQSSRYVEALSFAVNLTDRPALLRAELRQLGARHVIYGVQEEHYDVVVRAMMEMIADVLGSEFTPATRAVWQEFFDLVADAMKQGAAIYLERDAEARKQAGAPPEPAVQTAKK